MQLFLSTLDRMIYLLAFMAIGFLLTKCKGVPRGSAKVLSRLESMLFIPALVLNTFLKNFNRSVLAESGGVFLISTLLILAVLPVALLCARGITTDAYLKKIYTYGLLFANFSFMGNAIVQALFSEEVFFQYIIFSLPMWCLIYLWASPAYLMPEPKTKPSTAAEKVKLIAHRLATPMFFSVILGVIIGLFELAPYIPGSVQDVINASASCMSPVAMLLSGMAIAEADIFRILKKRGVYLGTALRLIVIPLVYGGILYAIRYFFPNLLSETVFVCALCTLAMPFGLNTVVIPGAYDLDIEDACGMALVSHVLSVGTIPLIFLLFRISAM